MSSSSRSTSVSRARSLLTTASDLIGRMGWRGLGQSIIGTMALVVTLGFGDMLNALFNIVIQLLNTLASIVPMLNRATFGGITGFLSAAFGAGAGAFGSGWVGLLGIFQAPLGLAVALFMFWEVAWYLDYVDRDFIGWAMDIPDWFSSADDSGVAAGSEEE